MKITTLVTDIDGVLTNGKFSYTKDGKLSKEFGPHDSDGIKILKSEGIKIIAITADLRGFDISKKRMDDLDVEIILVPEYERLAWFKDNISLKEAAFVGDGLFDSEIMKIVKISFAPANALLITKNKATHVTVSSGGEGVLLEVALKILKTDNKRKYKEIIAGKIL
tara:strand:+ start:239 stop:736 length:498 start_codon:yes stop_codon:yes gene_type:complete